MRLIFLCSFDATPAQCRDKDGKQGFRIKMDDKWLRTIKPALRLALLSITTILQFAGASLTMEELLRPFGGGQTLQDAKELMKTLPGPNGDDEEAFGIMSDLYQHSEMTEDELCLNGYKDQRFNTLQLATKEAYRSLKQWVDKRGGLGKLHVNMARRRDMDGNVGWVTPENCGRWETTNRKTRIEYFRNRKITLHVEDFKLEAPDLQDSQADFVVDELRIAEVEMLEAMQSSDVDDSEISDVAKSTMDPGAVTIVAETKGKLVKCFEDGHISSSVVDSSLAVLEESAVVFCKAKSRATEAMIQLGKMTHEIQVPATLPPTRPPDMGDEMMIEWVQNPM